MIDALHAQEGDREVILDTLTDDCSPAGVATLQNRADYTGWWDAPANRGGTAAYVPLHLDPVIGVIGCAPTDGTANIWYAADDLHLLTAGYARVDAGPHGFRAAVQARLAA